MPDIDPRYWCMRHVHGGTRRYDLSATDTPIVGASPYRVVLVLGQPVSGTVTYATLSDPVNGGIVIGAATGSPLVLNWWDVGDLVQRAWFARGSAAISVEVWEGGLTSDCWCELDRMMGVSYGRR